MHIFYSSNLYSGVPVFHIWQANLIQHPFPFVFIREYPKETVTRANNTTHTTCGQNLSNPSLCWDDTYRAASQTAWHIGRELCSICISKQHSTAPGLQRGLRSPCPRLVCVGGCFGLLQFQERKACEPPELAGCAPGAQISVTCRQNNCSISSSLGK